MNKQKIKDWFRIEKGSVEGLYYVPVIYVIIGITTIILCAIAFGIWCSYANPIQ